jgi:hypothetical protein
VLVGTSGYSREGMPDLPCVAHSLAGLAELLADTRRCGLPATRDTHLHERLRHDQRRTLGLQHPDTISTERHIACWSQQ